MQAMQELAEKLNPDRTVVEVLNEAWQIDSTPSIDTLIPLVASM